MVSYAGLDTEPLPGSQPLTPSPQGLAALSPSCEWLLQSESSKATEQSVSFRSARLVSDWAGLEPQTAPSELLWGAQE